MFHINNINKQQKLGQVGKIPHIIFRVGLEDLEHTTIQMSSVFHKQIGFGWNQRVTTRSCVHTLRPFGGCCAYPGCECRGCRKPTSLPHTDYSFLELCVCYSRARCPQSQRVDYIVEFQVFFIIFIHIQNEIVIVREIKILLRPYI